MTDTQMWLAVGIPTLAVLLGMFTNAFVFLSLAAQMDRMAARGDLVLAKLMGNRRRV